VVVGGAAQYDTGEDIAFIWTRRTGMRPLDVSLGGVEGGAVGINRHGQIVGASEFGPTDQTRAFLREPNGDVMDLGAFPDGDGSSGAGDINDRGQVIGSSSGPITSEAFIWSKRHGMQRLVPSSSLVVSPFRINNHGVVVGETVADNTRAFRWTRRTGLRHLPTLTGDASYSSAADINRWGMIVGSALAPAGSPHAVIWSRRSGIRDLNTLLDPSSSIASQILLVGARAINDRARIAAVGFYPATQQQSVFLLEPQRPGSPPCE
jgi:probable HAF family extracellular repeat protein